MATRSLNLAARFDQAIALHQTGQLALAQAIYEEILRVSPNCAEAMRLLGALAAQSRNSLKALDLINRAIELDPDNAAAHYIRGSVLRELKQWDAALASYERAIELKPDYAEAHLYRGIVLQEFKKWDAALACHDRAIVIRTDFAEAHFCRGNVLMQLRRLVEAVASYDQAIAARATFAEAYCNRGIVLKELGQMEAALSSYQRAISIRGDVAETHFNCGNVLRALKRSHEALSSYARALALSGEYVEAHCNRGNVFGELKQWESALASYERCIALRPDHPDAHSNRGNVLYELGRRDEALASYERAIAARPDFAEVHSNRGNVLSDLGRFTEALASCERAIGIRPDYAEAYCNRGNTLRGLYRFEEALASYGQAIAIHDDYANAHFNRSIAFLMRGDLASGWRGYEWRWKLETAAGMPRHASKPLWLGDESIAGKTVLLHAEQGLGDTLQFCRYATLAADAGATVILEVQQPLVNLLTGMPGVSQLVTSGSPLPDFTTHCPLMSLPLAFKTTLSTIPAQRRYLAGDARKVAHWRLKLPRETRPMVGIAWSGSATHRNDHHRSIPLQQLLSHLPRGPIYVCMQKEIREADRRVLDATPAIWNVAGELEDFSDTAALCECMDLVVTVDTSTAHLSAALGRPTWILLSSIPDWRWMVDRSDSPWYPAARLYRQPRIDAWDDVLGRVSADLIHAFGLARAT
jgi:tetratricopeptide (TPR) repeat protein